MGCANSKADDDEPEAAADPKDVKPSVDGEEHGSVTQTGFHSDVEAGKKHAFTEQMVCTSLPGGPTCDRAARHTPQRDATP